MKRKEPLDLDIIKMLGSAYDGKRLYKVYILDFNLRLYWKIFMYLRKVKNFVDDIVLETLMQVIMYTQYPVKILRRSHWI